MSRQTEINSKDTVEHVMEGMYVPLFFEDVKDARYLY